MSRTDLFFQFLLSIAAALLIRLLALTWRISLHGPDPNAADGPFVFCFWHGNQASLLAHPRVRPAVVMTSLSRDGSLQGRILRRLGFIVVRGSSSRGGARGLKSVISKIEEGCDALFAMDGPRGPLHRIKPGALAAAKATGVFLVPMRAEIDRAWVFHRSWDRYTLPKPFARVAIYRGHPIDPAEDRATIETALQEGLSGSRS